MVRKNRRPWVTCLVVLAGFTCLMVCCVTAIGVGGYYAFSNGLINQREILIAIGMGTGEISIVNIADDSLNTKLVRIDTDSGNPETINSETIAPFEISGYGGIEPGRYELHLTTSSGIPAGGICQLQITSGDVFQFVAVPSGIAVSKEGMQAQGADDMDMSTSGLCR